jgi:hypothetical protein
MKPVFQEYWNSQLGQYRSNEGDCFRACVASILNQPIWKVPHFLQFRGGWWDAFQLFMKHKNMRGKVVSSGAAKVNRYYIAVYSVKGTSYHHAVVWRNGKVVHDPNPRKVEIGKLRYLIEVKKNDL